MKIITNHHERFLKYVNEVPRQVINDYDHLDEDEAFDGWIQYRDRWYHLSDFMGINHLNTPTPTEFDGWHAYLNDSFFSGVVIKFSDDCESYSIGLFLS